MALRLHGEATSLSSVSVSSLPLRCRGWFLTAPLGFPPAELSPSSPASQLTCLPGPCRAGLLMDPISLQLGTENLCGCLVRLLSKDPEWLSAKMKFFLPNMDLGSGDQSPDPTQRVIQQLNKLHTQGQTTWQEFIHCVCMELDIPLHLEVPLLSTWGHGDGKSGREKCNAAS